MLVGTEHGPERLVATLADEVQVDLAERREEPVGIVDLGRLTAVRHLDAVVGDLGCGEDSCVDAAVLVRELGAGLTLSGARDDDHRGGPRAQRADGDRAVEGVRPEDRVRIVVAALDEALQVVGAHSDERHR